LPSNGFYQMMGDDSRPSQTGPTCSHAALVSGLPLTHRPYKELTANGYSLNRHSKGFRFNRHRKTSAVPPNLFFFFFFFFLKLASLGGCGPRRPETAFVTGWPRFSRGLAFRITLGKGVLFDGPRLPISPKGHHGVLEQKGLKGTKKRFPFSR